MIDWIVFILIAVAAVLGLIRGIVSQIMALAGLVAAFLLAPPLGKALGSLAQDQLGSSLFMAEKVSIFLIGVAIYVACRLAGYGVEKLVVNQVKEFKKLNRFGGAALGAVKCIVLIGIVFSFLALVPKKTIQAWVPKLPESRTYQWATKYNPMGDQKVLERMRSLRATVSDPKKMQRLQNDPRLRKLLSRHNLPKALEDKRFLKSIEKGDFDHLQDHEQLEKLMQDDQLGDLLARLDKETPGLK